jgi:hypothetical protein
VIGVKVEIMDPNARLPAEIDVLNLEQAKTALPDMVEALTPRDTLIDATVPLDQGRSDMASVNEKEVSS